MKLMIRSCLTVICATTLCVAATGDTPTYSLIVGPRTPIDPLSGIPSNVLYTPVSGSIADLNGDGAPDLILGVNGSPPAVYLNNKTANPFENVPGVFVSAPPGIYQSGISWGATVIADVDNDGHPDLAIAGFNTPNVIYLNDGSLTPFSGVTGITIGTQDSGTIPALGDVNGDGFADLAIGNTNQIASHLYLTHGAPLTSGTYTAVQVGTDVGYVQDTKIADVNGDGKPDLILTYLVANASGDPSGIAIYLNNGTNDPFGGVTPLRLLADSRNIPSVAFADFDNDGKLDMAVTNSDLDVLDQTLLVFMNTGSLMQPYSGSQMLMRDPNTFGCLGVSVGDVNGDSRPDLLFACQAPSSNVSPTPNHPSVGAIYLNNGTSDPFANVTPADIPAPIDSGYGRTAVTGTLVANGRPWVFVVDSTWGSLYPTVLAQDPLAQNDSVVTAINSSKSVTVLANDSAATGQTLDASSVMITTAPGHGGVTVDYSTGAVTYQPANGYSGADSFQYTVRDTLGATSHPAPVSVRVQPAPVATNDLVTISANQAANINVLGNDTSNGGALDSSTLQIAVVPVHGTAVASSGQIVYTPSQGYSGVDAIQYSVTDNLGTISNVATVSISVQSLPVAGNDSTTLAPGKNASLDVLGNDASNGGTLDAATLKIELAPSHGTAVVSGGHIVYTPADGYSGTDSLQYSVKDNLGGGSNVATVSLTVQAAPSVSNDSATLQVNQNVTIDVLANDKSVGGTLDSASLSIDLGPAHGTATVNAGKIDYTPTAGFSGSDSLQYSVKDNLGTRSSAATVSISVTAPPSTGTSGNTGGKNGGGSMRWLDLAVLALLLLWQGAGRRFDGSARRPRQH